MFAGIYYGGMYGGSTTFDPARQPGRVQLDHDRDRGQPDAPRPAGARLPSAPPRLGSFVAGTIATLLLALVAPTVVSSRSMLGPEDYFALAVLAFVAVAAVLGSSPLRGLAALCLGLFLGLVGTDLLSGQQRFAFAIPRLADGIRRGDRGGRPCSPSVRPCTSRPGCGTARSEVMSAGGSLPRRGLTWPSSWKPWLRGTAYGFPFGALPAGGAEIPTFLSYATEKRLTEHPEEFGRGAIEGVAGPEAANNAAAAGVLVPLLTLGLPTSATAAILLAAFQGYGIQPGPTLLTTESALVWTLIASLFIGNVMLLVLNLPFVGSG